MDALGLTDICDKIDSINSQYKHNEVKWRLNYEAETKRQLAEI